MYIDFSVTNQTLSRTSNDKTVENSQNYWRCRFNFVSADWGEVTKAAMFKTPDMEKPVIRLLVDNECDFPNGASRSTCNIALIGGGSEVITALASGTAAVRSGMIVTTNTVCIPFEDTLDSDDVDCDLSLPDNDFTEFLSKLNAKITKIDNLQEQIKVDLDSKQDKLTFDTIPTANSTNPVTSGGVKSALDGKADKQTANGGFEAGLNSVAGLSGVAIGRSASCGNGVSIGMCAKAGVNGLAIGIDASCDDGVSIGNEAKVNNSRGAIQLGAGTNQNGFSMQVYDYQLLADDAETKSATDGSKYLKDVGKLSSLATSVKDNIVNAINSIVTLLSQKVDKVDGKGLSANDYTDEDAAKLSALPTKSELNSDLEGKQDKLTFDTTPTANSTNPVTSGGVKSALDGKADKYNESGGFSAGDVAIAGDGGAIGSRTYTNSGASIGYGAQSENGAAVGMGAVAGNGFSGGKDAETTDSKGYPVDAIQLGTGMNSDEFTAQVYDYPLIANDAETPSAIDGSKYLKDVGKLSSLATSVKDNIVNAVNSLVAAHNDLKLKSVPHKDVSGYPVTFADHLADEEFIKCNVCGCKNLIPYPYADTTKTENGVTFTVNSDGSITVNGTATQNTIFNLKYHLTLPKGKFYFSGCPKNGSTSTYYIAVDVYKNKTWQKTYSNTGDGVSVNTENLDYDELTLSIIIVGNYTANNLVFKPQFESGTAATSFEVNKKIGTLDSTDGKYKIPVTLTGKNVLPYPYKDSSKTGNGISFTVNGDRSVSLTGTATGKATYYFARSFELKSGTYTLSEKMKNQSSNVSIILDAYAGGTFLSSHSASAKKTTVITLSQDATVSIYAYVPTGVVCENYPVKPQLEIGTVETEYEPYTANGVTAALDTALGEGEYIDIINKKRYGTDGSTTDITVSGSLKTIDSAKNHISCGTTETPSKIELSYWQDINKVLSETTNAILAQGGNV